MDNKEKREEAIRSTKSNLILDAAKDAFSKKGYHETRLEDIATEAGFSKASLYNYYVDKTEIFVSLGIREFDGLLKELKNQINPDLHILKIFEIQLRTVFNFFGVHFAFIVAAHNFRAMCLNTESDIISPHNELLEKFRCKFAEIQKMHSEIIRKSREKGEIESLLEDTAIAGYISSLVRGIVFEWKIKGAMGDIEEEISKIILFLQCGLGCNNR